MSNSFLSSRMITIGRLPKAVTSTYHLRMFKPYDGVRLVGFAPQVNDPCAFFRMYARHDRIAKESHCLILYADTVGQGEVSLDLADGIEGNLNIVDVIHVPVRVQLPHAYGDGRG